MQKKEHEIVHDELRVLIMKNIIVYTVNVHAHTVSWVRSSQNVHHLRIALSTSFVNDLVQYKKRLRDVQNSDNSNTIPVNDEL